MTHVKFGFEDCALDTRLRELRRDGELIAMQPQVFDLLVHLLKHRDHVVSRDDLIAVGMGRPDRFGFDARQPHQRRPQRDRRQWQGTAADPDHSEKRPSFHRCRGRT